MALQMRRRTIPPHRVRGYSLKSAWSDMRRIDDPASFDFDALDVDPSWNTGGERELRVHRIHSYPAKFPAFITTKALEYAQQQRHAVKTIADVFCGCGTTAVEARRNDRNFWGCDINPVATLIATVKSSCYHVPRLKEYLATIVADFTARQPADSYSSASDRLQYWYNSDNYDALVELKDVIEQNTPSWSRYRQFFLCAFSNILKSTSLWLTKSIKPQRDLTKTPSEVLPAFTRQCDFMVTASVDIVPRSGVYTKIDTCDFLSPVYRPPSIDMIVTSPPYVTSYEYADLHQLSSLWLGYAHDYRDLRRGTIGSSHSSVNLRQDDGGLLATGAQIVRDLNAVDSRKARAVQQYFSSMQDVATKTLELLGAGGIALFVIGNTEYKGVRVENARHFVEALYAAGFPDVRATKRKVSRKTLTPYRDERGRFSTDAGGRHVYSDEFIIVGRR